MWVVLWEGVGKKIFSLKKWLVLQTFDLDQKNYRLMKIII
jgi:hypothetical protein